MWTCMLCMLGWAGLGCHALRPLHDMQRACPPTLTSHTAPHPSAERHPPPYALASVHHVTSRPANPHPAPRPQTLAGGGGGGGPSSSLQSFWAVSSSKSGYSGERRTVPRPPIPDPALTSCRPGQAAPTPTALLVLPVAAMACCCCTAPTPTPLPRLEAWRCTLAHVRARVRARQPAFNATPLLPPFCRPCASVQA